MKPDISIILPCRNEVAFIDACIGSILSQKLDGRHLELLVADGMSTDGTKEKLASWEAKDPRVRVVDNPKEIAPTGLNEALKLASAPVVVRMDAHSVFPEDYLLNCLAALERSGAHNVGGVLVTLPRGNSIGARIVQAVSTHWFGVGGGGFRIGGEEGPVDTVPFGCFRSEVFDRVGLFDERLTRHQDYEFNARIRAAGGLVWIDPKITIDYFNQPSVRGLYKQAFLGGRWDVVSWYLAPHAFHLRHLVPGLFVLFVLLGLIASAASPEVRTVYLLVLTLYAALAVFAALQQAKRFSAPWLSAALPFAFIGYHLSFGAGVIFGGLLVLLDRKAIGSGSRPWKNAPSFRVKPLNLTRREGSGELALGISTHAPIGGFGHPVNQDLETMTAETIGDATMALKPPRSDKASRTESSDRRA